jgi:hypothetical protein
MPYIQLLINKINLATSPVGGFEKQAEEFVDKIKARGCRVMNTTDAF